MKLRYIFLFLLLSLIIPDLLKGQVVVKPSGDTIKINIVEAKIQTDSINYKRLTPVIITGTILYAGSMATLYNFWYKNYPQTHFHFFNDNNEYLQMDKMGHFTTSYYISKLSYNTLHWTGLSEKKSILYGGMMGIGYLTVIEILDGFSTQWGFSVGDMTANTLGAGLFVGQQLAWKEQRIQLKWSFHQTKYARYRPDLFGKNLGEQWVKDYNGQTYWLSANIKSFLKKEGKFPGWLNLAFGYGAEGMTGAAYNSMSYNGQTIPYYQRYRQFYLSGDIDLGRIHTQNKTLHGILNALSFIKIPFPTLEFSRGKIITRPLYF